MKKAILSISTAVLLALSPMAVCVNATGKTSSAPNSGALVATEGNGYEEYYSKFQNLNAGKDITVKGNAFKSATGKTEKGNGVFYPNSSVTYEINVPKTGLYNIGLTYTLLDNGENEAEISLKLNGKAPFNGTDSLRLPRFWVDDGETREDSLGNQTAPIQKQQKTARTEYFRDNNGIILNPYTFYFKAGKNTITLKFKDTQIKVDGLHLSAPEKLPTYSELSATYSDTGNNAKAIVLEAEKAFAKSSRSIVGKSDSNSPKVSPGDAMRQKVNYIGSSNWQTPNDTIEWKFNVETDGYYKLGFVYKQSGVLNGRVYRNLKIDGKTPFAEAEHISFDYSRDWEFSQMGDGEKPYLIYLKAGEHTLSLSVTLAESAEVYKQLEQVTSSLRELYMNIIMITGETPDPNRDYDLYHQIPNFEATIKGCYDKLNEIADLIRKNMGVESNTQISTLVNTARTLKNMLNSIYRAEDYLKDYYSNYSSLCSSLSDIRVLPLSLDRIIVAPASGDFGVEEKSFIDKFMFGLKRFVISFGSEYNTISATTDGDREIKLWVNWGRDQAMALNSLIETTFTPKTGIKVNLQITAASVINGMLVGNAPDIAIGCSRSDPVNFAMRGAVYNLKNFKDFPQVMTRFAQTADVPFTYKNGIYALPDTQSHYIMYYRSDILEKLGLSVPTTWDEFISTATVLQMNNLEAWVSYTKIADTGTVNLGLGGLNLYASILGQMGGQVYNDEQNATEFLSPISLSAFSFWTDIYTKYKFPVELSFYNRFRVGITPLGIEPTPHILNLRN